MSYCPATSASLMNRRDRPLAPHWSAARYSTLASGATASTAPALRKLPDTRNAPFTGDCHRRMPR